MNKIKILLLVFCTMGFTLLLVVGLLERDVVALLFNDSAQVTEESIRLTFSALQRIVGVLPYTLGVIIAGTFILSLVQLYKSQRHWLAIGIILVVAFPMVFNIFIADTAAVVAGIETTKATDPIDLVKSSLLGAVQQHYIGLVGFTLATILQLIYTLQTANSSK